MSATFRCLSQEDVVAASGLDMDACLRVIGDTLDLHHRGETVAPMKAVIHWSDDLDTDEKLGRIMAMPAYVGGETQMAGLKWIPSVPSNPKRGLPRGIGVILLSDPETGLPRAFIDGTVISAMRTGAVSGVAARELARDGASVLGLLGAGVQARTQLMALERALPTLEEIRVFDLIREKAERLAGEQTDGPTRRVVEGPEDAVRDCDVVVPATMAPSPFIPAGWLAPGAVAISVSSLDFDVDTVPAADLLVADDVAHETAHAARLFARADAAGLLDRGRGHSARCHRRGRASRAGLRRPPRGRQPDRAGHRGRRLGRLCVPPSREARPRNGAEALGRAPVALRPGRRRYGPLVR